MKSPVSSSLNIRRPKKLGSPPGSLVHVGKPRSNEPRIETIIYDDKDEVEGTPAVDEQIHNLIDPNRVSWVNVIGVHDPALIGRIGKELSIHPLFLEDIMNTTIRPKMVMMGDRVLLIMKMIAFDENTHAVLSEQISFIIDDHEVISLQETDWDVFDAVRQRIRQQGSLLRSRGADFLAYALIDVLVDHYYTVIDGLDEKVSPLEELLLVDPDPHYSQTIHHMRNDILQLRKAVWPLREMLRDLKQETGAPIRQETRIFYDDIYDHVIQIMDQIEMFRDVLSGLSDMYMNSLSNRMNSVMKTLTLIATIFIPLTFIAGIYGMNFSYMPELGLKWGYFAVLGIMVAVTAGMIIYFKRKKWL